MNERIKDSVTLTTLDRRQDKDIQGIKKNVFIDTYENFQIRVVFNKSQRICLQMIYLIRD